MCYHKNIINLYLVYKNTNYEYLIGCAVTEVPQLEPGGWQNIIWRIIRVVTAF